MIRNSKTPTLVLCSLIVLASCATNDSVDSAATSKPPENHVSDQMKHADHGTLPLPKRLAFMTGHVEAGLALYRAGEPEMAAKHLEHPVSETHASERVGLDALGFEADLFIAVSEALESGVPASQIEPKLQAAQANLAAVSQRAGGDATDIIHYLMDTVLEEYAIGVRDGKVKDAGEYQDAFGFTQVALTRAGELGIPKRQLVQARLQDLLNAWPKAPVPPSNPTPVSKIETLVEQVRQTLNAHHR